MFTKNAIKVLEKRYLLRDEHGQVEETPTQLFRRVAQAVAKAEANWGASAAAVQETADKFFEAMHNRQFLPNSPTLMNAGKPNGQLSACFVLPVPDSLDGIFETCKNAALIHKTGGGTGFSFSRLRPAHDRVASSCGVASGPISFMMVYDAATEAIRQGGTRRGANMGILRVDHPDIRDFVTCKRDTTRLNNFNISVAATDQFMDAVENDAEYDIVHPRSGKVLRTEKAREIFEKMVENAHATGEPGLVFIDRINASDPIKQGFDSSGKVIPGTEDIEATNPCGEQPLGPGDACNLGSINLTRFVDQSKHEIDWAKLADAINLSVRFLDDVVEANHYPLPFIKEVALNNRRIGLGIMGWAETLIMLGVPYDSDEAVNKGDEMMAFVQKEAHLASGRLAQERGSFPNWQYSTWAERNQPMRNATVTTIAPTGTISIIAGTSSGIEPLFAISFVRRVLGGSELIEVNPLFEEMAKEQGFYSAELMEQIAREGTLDKIEGLPDQIKKVWVCSHDISYEWHVKMQVAFQKHTDNAVSKTINLPHYAPIDEVREAYLGAWRQGLKGITVYRDASRATQVLNIRKTDELKRDTEYGDSRYRTEPRAPKTASEDYKQSNPKSSGKAISTTMAVVSTTPPSANVYQISERRCVECGSTSAYESRYEACVMCRVCGYTKC